MKIDRQNIPTELLRCETQESLGMEGYNKGAEILNEFFARELAKFDTPDLHPLGKEIFEIFKRGGSIADYEAVSNLYNK